MLGYHAFLCWENQNAPIIMQFKIRFVPINHNLFV